MEQDMDENGDRKGKGHIFDLNAYAHCEDDVIAWKWMCGEMGAEDSKADKKMNNMVNGGAIDAENVDDLQEVDLMTMKFDTIEDAECFYNIYGRATGFSIRRGYAKKDPEDSRTVRYRSWVCSREGEREEKHILRNDRKREAKSITRVNCGACLKIRLDDNEGKYIVSRFVKEHTHQLGTHASIPFMRSHRRVADSNYAQAHTLRRAGIRTSQIMKLFVLQAGGYQNVPFLIKDLYNKMNCERLREIADGDAERAIGRLAAKKETDSNFYYEYCCDSKGRLTRLLWADSWSRMDYKCYGDVLVFDSTYRTQSYKMPLVVLCGVNNHYSTAIFACALIADENEESYDWVLQKFVKCMGGKEPVSIVTDGDKAMKKAIKKVLPNATHRLCSWHLEKNASQYVGNKQFLQAFKTCMFMNCSQDQFEFEWANMVSKLHLGNNEWVKKIHKKKEQWAIAYLRGNFFAGMRSTQRCEKMNDVLKMYLKPELKLFEFVRAFDLAISWLRTEEARNEANTQHTTLLPITELHCLENHAAEVFSRRIFLMVREQLKSQGIYCRVDGIDDGVQCVHMVSHSYSGSEWRVQYNRHSGEMRCSCMRMESLCLPCGHMFRIMVFEGMRKIPDSCIMKRWSRMARDGIGEDWERQPPDTENLEMGRYAALVGASNSWCYYAAKSSAEFKHAMGVIHRETDHARSLCMANATDAATLIRHEAGGQGGSKFGVLDPLICRAKGDHQTKEKGRQSNKKCGNCGSRDGHNRRTCNSSPKNTAWHEIRGASYDGEHGWTADEDAGSRHQSIISHYGVRVCSVSEGQCGSFIQQPSYEWNQQGFAGVQEGRYNELDVMDALELAEW